MVEGQNHHEIKPPSYVLEGLVSGPFSVASLFHPLRSRIKIRFENRKEAGKGIMLVLKEYGSIRGLKGGYGLSSEEQLKFLDGHGIKYQRIN